MNIAIAGGGITGLTFMNFLQHADVELFEQKSEFGEAGSGILLGINAMKIMRKLNLDAEILKQGQQLSALNLTDQKGRILQSINNRQIEKQTGFPTASILRTNLHKILAQNISRQKIHMSAQISGMKQDSQLRWSLEIENKPEQNQFDLLVGADGIHSVVRDTIFPKDPLRYSGYTCWRFMTKMPENMPPDEGFEFIGSGRRFGIIPAANDKVYCFSTLNAPMNYYHDHPLSKEEFAKIYFDFGDLVQDCLKNLLGDNSTGLIQRDISDLKKVYMTTPDNRAILTGDAGHATTPNMGQGAAMGIEDAAIFAQLFERFSDTASLIKNFSKLRKGRVASIRRNSLWFGKMGQLENPVLMKLRNLMYSSVPASLSRNSLVKILLNNSVN